MEESHREHIRKNINELIRTTKFSELICACEQVRLLSNTMRTQIEGLPDADENEKHKKLFIKLTKRGPTAYEELIQLLIKLKFTKAVHILRAPKHNDNQYISMHNRPSKPVETQIYANSKHYLPEGCYPSKDNVDSNETLALVPFTDKILLVQPFEVKKSQAMRYDRKVPYYPMKSKNRGVFFMVNIIDFPKTKDKTRSGAEIDGNALLYLFQELGFTCFPYTNLSRDEFFSLLDQLRSSEYFMQTESFVMALMSHGEMDDDDMHDRVLFNDGSVVKVKEIEDFLSNDECFSLLNKPKVLIFPFCRGKRPDKGLQTDGINMGPNSILKNIPTRSDMLVCYASVRGFQALRDPDTGSWYIQAFCRVLAEHAHDTHLEDMLKLIGQEMRKLRSANGEVQMPAYYNHGFNKQLYFNPGLYEE